MTAPAPREPMSEERIVARLVEALAAEVHRREVDRDDPTVNQATYDLLVELGRMSKDGEVYKWVTP